MRTTHAIAFALSMMLAQTAAAQPAPAPVPAPAAPVTFWNKLGIPQGVQKMRDATINRRGNNPQDKRVPPLKRIADPQNLQSDNPAIKTAAKIKQDQDMAAQKIKAIKYLATIGCGCYPGVREALLDALDDCTEAVRYEAALAFCQAAGNACNRCDNSGCCNAAVMTKLQDMAFGKDDQCCPKEASARVRCAAEMALNACRAKHPAGPAPVVPGKELPAPEQVPAIPTPAPKEVPAVPKEVPTPPPPPALNPVPDAPVEKPAESAAPQTSIKRGTSTLARLVAEPDHLPSRLMGEARKASLVKPVSGEESSDPPGFATTN